MLTDRAQQGMLVDITESDGSSQINGAAAPRFTAA